jgi:hypothetical protein
MRCMMYLLLGFAVFPAAASTGAESDSKTAADAAALLVQQVPAVPDDRVRGKLACKLPNLMLEVDREEITPAFIDSIAGLLTDREGTVALCAAESLVRIGGPARRAPAGARRGR